MAITNGINAGFVAVAPTADPAGGNNNLQGNTWATKDTSPAGATSITEIGWYNGNDATDNYLFDIGLYADDGGSDPAGRLQVQTSIDMGTRTGWISTAVNWPISPSTPYWLAVYGRSNFATDPFVDASTSGGSGYAIMTGDAGIPNPWGSSFATDTDAIVAIYAVYSSGVVWYAALV